MSRKGQPAISLGDVASSILDAKLPDGIGPILARRQSLERKIAEVHEEEREQAEVARAKRALRSQAHLTLRSSEVTTDLVLETMLKKVATKGVVALFNAVRTAQRDQQPDGGDAKVTHCTHACHGPRLVRLAYSHSPPCLLPCGVPPATCLAASQATQACQRWRFRGGTRRRRAVEGQLP